MITTIETGLRLDDLEHRINNLNSKVDCKNYEQSLAVRRLDDIEMNINSLHNQIANSQRDETISIVLPPAPPPVLKQRNNKKR